jgi:hypothetical protein
MRGLQSSLAGLLADAIEGGSIATESVAQESRNTADSCDADTSQVMDASIGQALLEQLDDLPAVDQCLELGRRTQIPEKSTAFLDVPETDNRPE